MKDRMPHIEFLHTGISSVIISDVKKDWPQKTRTGTDPKDKDEDKDYTQLPTWARISNLSLRVFKGKAQDQDKD